MIPFGNRGSVSARTSPAFMKTPKHLVSCVTALMLLASFALGSYAAEVRKTPTRPDALKVAAAAGDNAADTATAKSEVYESANKKDKRFGPYRTLTYDESILQEVVYRKSDHTVWLRLRPEVRDEEIVVKISNRKFAEYRIWFTTNDYELVSPANAGKQPNALSDWLTTQSRFIEYYMNDKLFLHLERLD